MFSNNQKISIRQIRRLLILDLFGASSLLIPGLLSRNTGPDGVFCILGAGALTLGYVWVLGKVLAQMQGSYYSYMKRLTGTVASDILMLFYLLFFLLLSAFALYELTGLIRDWLLPDMNQRWIALLVLLLAVYATIRGIEGRARVYEIMFWFLGVPLMFMMLLAALEADPDYWTPVCYIAWPEFGRGILTVFAFFLPVFFILFLKPYCSKPEKLAGCAGKSVLILSVLNVGIYLILLGNFQSGTTGVLKRPIITLMSMVQLPGGFFARLDAFMTAIWFFSLFALMNTAVFYGGKIVEGLFCGDQGQGTKEKRRRGARYSLLSVVLPVYGLTLGFLSYGGAKELYRSYIQKIAVPVLVLVPMILAILGHFKYGARDGKK